MFNKQVRILKYFAISTIFVAVFFLSPNITSAADRYWVGGTGNWSDDDNHWAATSGGAPANLNIPTAVDNCIFDSLSNATAYTVTVDASATCLNLNFSQTPLASGTVIFTGSESIAVTGSLTLLSGMSFTYDGTITMNATSGTNTITSNGVTITGALTLDGVGGTWQLSDNLAIDSTKLLTVTNGTFDANDMDVSMGGFSSANTNIRVLTMGDGTWTLTGSGITIWLMTDSTNLTFNKGNPIVANYNGSVGTRSIGAGTSALGMNNPDFNITAGTDSIALNTYMGSVNFTGFSGTLAASTRSIFGSLTLSSSMTTNSGVGSTTFAATSGTHTITTNGVTLGFPIIFDGVGGTWQLGSDLTLLSTRNITLTNGVFNANNYNVTAARFLSSNSNVRTLTMGSGIWELTGTSSIVWSISTSTNLDLDADTSTIKITADTISSRIFSGGGQVYHNFWFDGGASSNYLQITDSNTFYNFRDTGTAAHSYYFNAGTTQIVENFNVSGSEGNVITLISNDSSGTFALVKTGDDNVSSDYLNIQHSVATPDNTWYAGRNSVDNQSVVNAGSGWIFTEPPVMTSSSGSRARSHTVIIAPISPQISLTTDCLLSYNFSPSTGNPCPKPVILSCILTQTLKQGSTGGDVKCLQNKLKIISDGIFGPITKTSVINFQRLNNLISDGIVGPMTRGVMNGN